MTTATATTRRILIIDNRDEATLRAAGYVPVQEATAESIGVFATGYSDITETRDVPAVLDPDTGAELVPATVETVIVSTAQQQAEKACEAWLMSLPALPVPAPVYSRGDYKAALDAMLDAQAATREYDNIAKAALRASRPGPFYVEGCWFFDLQDFTWSTSDALSRNPPAGPAPTPAEFAASILAAFVAKAGECPARV